MHYTPLKSKIHRATVTDANLHYEGSITVDARLLQAVPTENSVRTYHKRLTPFEILRAAI
ncbi:MAG: hypothetical protein CMJ64_30255 [Planctomycetaceae bacterium]|nr:hypothetical protein [Planctomycetaceae bacterium]